MIYKQMAGFSRYKIFEDGSVQNIHGKILKQNLQNNYHRVTLTADDGSVKTLSVHRIIANLYHGLALDNHNLEPDHKDNNKLNNHKDNIEIVTKSENCRRRSGRPPNSNIDTQTHKQCSKCFELKPKTGFKPQKGSIDGLGSWCHDCTKAYKRAYSRLRGWTKS